MNQISPNLIVAAVTALFPLLLGFIWYNPKVFGTAWMKGAGVTEESMKGGNMALVLGLTYLASFFIAFSLQFIVIHQFGFQSMILPEPGHTLSPEKIQWFNSTIAEYHSAYRRYRHGALHGTIVGLFFITPVISINALFERRSFKYIAINAGFWIVCCAVMGAIECHWV